MRHVTIVLLVGLTVLPLVAQTPTAEAMRFEVASVRPVTFPDEVRAQLAALGGTCGLPAMELTGDRVHVRFSQLCGLIRVAFNVADYQVVGVPDRETAGFFEVDARAEAGSMPTTEEARAMLQALLADRFGLRVHHELRDMRVYALTVAPDGPKAAPCSDPAASSWYAPGVIVSCEPPVPMARVAQFLTREVGQPVRDETGLTAGLTFELRWLPEGMAATAGSPPGLVTAIREQLGLRLEPRTAPVDVLVIDGAERLEPN